MFQNISNLTSCLKWLAPNLSSFADIGESQYSLNARVAQDILTIPATSTPSERLFSASGLLSEGKMSSISPENLEKRVLVKVNIGKPET